MPDLQYRAPGIDMRATPLHPVLQTRRAARCHFMRCREPAFNQGTLQRRLLRTGVPVAGGALDAITVLKQYLQRRPRRTRPQGQAKTLVAQLMPIDQLAYLLVLRFRGIAAD